ncbi:MAG: sulfite oxidase [Mycobacterium sp.]|nr:sulfite oxidase [Mycobacterium sp.]
MTVVDWGKRADMIVHEVLPFNAEASLSALAAGDITPIDAFYARNHGPIPDIRSDDWRLTVDGLVNEALSLSFDDLTTGFPAHTVVATLQCAGNRRVGFNEVSPIFGEDPWGPGATSTAEWHGVRLADVLTAAGVHRRDDLHVAFAAPDVSDLATPSQRYGSSIPLSKAMSEEVLLSWQMNSQSLPRLHGGPVRVVVPGYIGARSVKWLTDITVQEHPSDNYFQSTAYHILPPDVDPDTAEPHTGFPLSSVALNSDILEPADGATVAAGALKISGYAFAGDDRRVTRVDVSLDGGRSWRQADLGPAISSWAWQRWTLTVEVEPGPLTITARAWDSTGASQPESAAALWNPKGYANNSWASVRVEAR